MSSGEVTRPILPSHHRVGDVHITRGVDGFLAFIEGGTAMGVGNSELEAVGALCRLLGDLVKDRDDTIHGLQQRMKLHQ